MRVAVMGVGAVGMLYGGWLQKAGLDVRFVARGARLDALRAGPLEAVGRYAFKLPRVSVFAEPKDAGPVDAILLSTKLYDLETAARAALPALSEKGIFVAVQNGIQAFDTLKKFIPPSRIAVGPVFCVVKQTSLTSVECGGPPERIVLGNPAHVVSDEARTLVDAWSAIGVDASTTEDIASILWTKFIGLATGAAITSLSRLPAGIVYHDPGLLRIVRQSIAEVMRVGEAEGIRFPAGMSERVVAMLQSFPPGSVASMRHDLDAGRRLELDGVSGEIVRLASKHGVVVPFHELAYAMLSPFQNGTPVIGAP